MYSCWDGEIGDEILTFQLQDPEWTGSDGLRINSYKILFSFTLMIPWIPLLPTPLNPKTPNPKPCVGDMRVLWILLTVGGVAFSIYSIYIYIHIHIYIYICISMYVYMYIIVYPFMINGMQPLITRSYDMFWPSSALPFRNMSQGTWGVHSFCFEVQFLPRCSL